MHFIFSFLNRSLFIIIILTLIISLFFVPILNSNSFSNSNSLDSEIIDTNPDGFVWPIPGYTKISSNFGIDIPAPEGTKFIAVADGKITFRDFLGAGGYTITLSFDDFKVSYCHCDPNWIVSVGDEIKQGQVIGCVGPKYVYGVPGNQYHDSDGKPTNGATTGCHLHLGIRVNDKYQNPLNYF